MIANDICVGFTSADLASLFIHTRNATDFIIADHITGKLTILNAAVIHPDDAADLILASGGRYFSAHREITYFGTFLHITEKTCRRTIPRKLYIGDRKIITIENSRKCWDTEFTFHAQNDVVAQHYFDTSGPAVQHTVLRKPAQILLRADLYNCIILLLRGAAITAAALILFIG